MMARHKHEQHRRWFLWWFDPGSGGARRHHRHHRHHPCVVLFVDGFGVLLHPNQENEIMVDVTVGHNVSMSLLFRDTNKNPMLTQPTLDAPPAWSNSTPATETLKVAADGLTAEADTVAAGGDSVSVSLAVGGVSFSASLSVNVSAAPQVLGSVEIVPVVSA